MSKQKTFLTVKEVGDLLGVQGAAVRYWIRDGKLKAERYGQGYLVRLSDVKAFEYLYRKKSSEKDEKLVKVG